MSRKTDEAAEEGSEFGEGHVVNLRKKELILEKRILDGWVEGKMKRPVGGDRGDDGR